MYILHRKVERHGYTTTFHIRANNHQNRKRKFKIGTKRPGACCWKIHSTNGETQEFEPGEKDTPKQFSIYFNNFFISKIESKKCGEK